MTAQAIKSTKASFQFLHTDNVFLKEINLTVHPGECVLICGKSGSGKTTFSRLLNGLAPNYIEGELTGEVKTYNLSAGKTSIKDYVQVVGSVFQNPKTQHFTANTSSELALPLENIGMAPEKISKKVTETAQKFHIEHLLDRDIFSLSGGEKQQIAMASATVLDPQVLVLDEVSSNLDQEAISRLQENIKQKKADGTTIILTEHRLAWTLNFVDRYVLFDSGQVIKEWTNAEFRALSNNKLADLGLRATDLSNKNQAIEKKKQIHQDLKNDYLLHTENLTIGYKKTTVQTNLGIGLDPHKIIGITGKNGVGKTTLANTLTGLLKPLGGKILWQEKLISAKELRKKSFLVMQNTNYQLFSDSVNEEVSLNAKHPEWQEKVLEQLNLTALTKRHPMSLSDGQKQRVAIASALLSGKKLLIFDEPTSGLDFTNMQRFGTLLRMLKQTDVIIAIITHDVELAADWCDEIIALKQ